MWSVPAPGNDFCLSVKDGDPGDCHRRWSRRGPLRRRQHRLMGQRRDRSGDLQRVLRRTAWTVGAVLASTVVSMASRTGATRPPPSPITIAFTGDDLGSPALWPAARRNADGHGLDFRPMLARLRPLIRSADLAICHLETPLSGPGVPPSGSPRYVAPHQLAPAIRYAGYDGCSTASNHTLDAGTAGIRSTLDALDAQDLSHTGSARTQAESRSIVRYQVGDVAVAHLAYTFGFNGLHPKHAWMANRIDPDAIVARAERARREGADLVVVSLHWGQELSHRGLARSGPGRETARLERRDRSDRGTSRPRRATDPPVRRAVGGLRRRQLPHRDDGGRSSCPTCRTAWWCS